MSAPPKVRAFLVVGILAASQSGNIIRIGEAHPVAIAAWRLFIASCLLAPLAGRRLAELRRLTRRESGLLLASGAALALHFIAWIAAVQMTTVANAAIFFAANPVLTAAAGHLLFGERITGKLALSVGLGLAGVVVIGLGDLGLDPQHLGGDLAALVCSLLFTVYFLLGKRLRRVLSTTTYASAVYGVAAPFAGLFLFVLDVPVFDYDSRTWLCFVLMALVPTMLGHTSFNSALRHIDASRVSAATLSEPALAGLVAWFAWDEAVTGQAFAGYALIAVSVLVLLLDRAPRVSGSRGAPA